MYIFHFIHTKFTLFLILHIGNCIYRIHSLSHSYICTHTHTYISTYVCFVIKYAIGISICTATVLKSTYICTRK